MGEIITERYIHAGGGTMFEGNEAYIKFFIEERIFWVYGYIILLESDYVVIRPRYGDRGFRLEAEEVLDITDSDIFYTIAQLLQQDQIVEINELCDKCELDCDSGCEIVKGIRKNFIIVDKCSTLPYELRGRNNL